MNGERNRGIVRKYDPLMRLALEQEHERTDQPLTESEQKDPMLSATWELVRARRRYITAARELGRSFAWISAAVSMDELHVRHTHEADDPGAKT